MQSPTRGASRLVRVSALAGGCVSITAIGHTAAHGQTSVLGLALISVLMLAAAVFMTSRELGFAHFAVFAAASQIGAHLMLATVSPSHAMTGAPSIPAGLSGHELHRFATAASGGESLVDRLGVSPGMILAHAVGCVAIALVLRVGERALFAVHRAMVQVIRFVLAPTVALVTPDRPVGLSRSTPEYESPHPTLLVELAASVVRRGPPTVGLLTA